MISTCLIPDYSKNIASYMPVFMPCHLCFQQIVMHLAINYTLLRFLLKIIW